MVERDFRGVVQTGLVLGDERFALAVAHPHPDGDFGGGPGPDADWHRPYDSDAYAALVDDDFDPDDARYELRYVGTLAIGRAGAWTHVEIPATGTIDRVQLAADGSIGVLVSYGGGAYYVARCTLGGAIESFDYRGQPRMWVEPKAAWLGDAVVLAGALSFDDDAPTQVGLARRDGDAMVWHPTLGVAPGRVHALHAADDEIIAGGTGLWRHRDGTWESLHDPLAGSVTFVDHLATGELVAGTDRGAVIVGHGSACRTIGKVDEIHSAARFGDALYVADDERVYRHRDGAFEVCLRFPGTVGRWRSAGSLVATPDALWLFGSHAILRTGDGSTWAPVAVR